MNIIGVGYLDILAWSLTLFFLANGFIEPSKSFFRIFLLVILLSCRKFNVRKIAKNYDHVMYISKYVFRVFCVPRRLTNILVCKMSSDGQGIFSKAK